jgi:50S ribosomal subunit-associated GTPase HflX
VGNKADGNKVVPEDKIKAWAKERNIKFMYVSAKSGTNVNELFSQLAQAVIAKETNVEKTTSFQLRDSAKTKERKTCC